LAKILIIALKINVDNKTHFLYLDGYWFCLIDVSIYWTAAESSTKVIFFSYSALKKRLLDIIIAKADDIEPLLNKIVDVTNSMNFNI